MARLTLPAVGTVVSVEGDLEQTYRATGWVDVDSSSRQVEASPEKPQVKRGRPRKTDK